MEEIYERRRLSFGAVADDYERARPGYPEAAIAWALGPEPHLLADVGAGTGKLTRQLIELGHNAIAVEPSHEMLAQFRQNNPGAPAVRGSAEDLPFRDASLDAVVAGQAYHWFDPERAPDELARVLKPGGTLALIWNFRDESFDWVAKLSRVIGSETMEDSWSETIEHSPHFDELDHRIIDWRQPLDRVALRALVRSRSYVASLDPPEQARVLDDVETLTREHPDLRDHETFELPYGCSVYRAARI